MHPEHRRKWKYILLLPFLLLLLAFTSSCGFKDIDKRSFVVATSIDASGEESKPYRITLRLAIPSTQIEPGKSKSEVETITAGTIAEGMRLLKSHVDKELDFGHCKVFIIGEKLAEKGYQDVIEWMMRRRDIQNVADMAIGRPNSEELMHVQPMSERYPGNALFLSFSADGTDSSYTVVTSLSELSRRSYEKGLDPILPIIEHTKNSFIIDKAAVLDEKAMKLILTPEETQIYLQVADNFSNSAIKATYKNKTLLLYVSYIKTKYKITTVNNRPAVVMNITVHGLFEEAPEGLFSDNWKTIEKELGESYSGQVKALLDKLRNANVDPMGFGLKYRATHPGNAAYDNWEKLYPDIQFIVKSDIKIESTGMIE